MIDQIFGIPLYKSSIDSNSYDKKGILNTILSNFEKSNERNNWDNESYIKSKIHHSLCDESNQTFEKPDFSSLKSVYESEIKKYLKMMNYKNLVFKFEIVNYTVMTKDSQLSNHIHTDCEFTSVHYLKFDSESTDSTLFHNSHDYAKYLISSLSPSLSRVCDNMSVQNSWMYQNFKIPTQEDDLIIFPAVLEHSVPRIENDGERVTIVANIHIKDYDIEIPQSY
tara:strand:+ start:731 stop:1402 length:672 start_codon:yes stop_codon:yes gene_type:complete